MLTIYTSALSANYTLMATLPPYLLAICSSSLSRPVWEPLIYYSSVTFMVFLLVCVLAAAIFESNRILRNTIIALTRDQNIQPVLDLRAVGSEVTTETHDFEDQSKLPWTHNAILENDFQKLVLKGTNSVPSDSHIANGFRVKSSIGNGLIHKRKSERSLSKRYSDYEYERSSWNSMFSRSSNIPSVKNSKSSNICFTTEPYTPLANLKPRDIPIKTSEPNEKTKCDHHSEHPIKKTKKKSDDARKKNQDDFVLNSNSFDEVESSSTTTESSSNDDGDKEVESMFFKTVRHHLQTKVGKDRLSKYRDSSPLRVRKSIDKLNSSPADNEWEADDDVVLDKAIVVVRSCRRLNSLTNKLKRQSSMSGKLKLDPLSTKCKSSALEKSMKTSSKKDRSQNAKKARIDKGDKASSFKGTFSDNSTPLPPPPPPVWTASFSDIVARSEFSYSSIVALKNPQPSTSQKLPTTTSTSTGTVGSNHSFNATWSNWTNLPESAICQESPQPTSTNSLFAHSPQPDSGTSYDNVWSEAGVIYHPSIVKAFQEQRDMEMQPPFNNSELNWPVMPSLWEPLYTPSASVENPAPVWGSNVWAPPALPSPMIQDEMVQPTMEYDPFRSLSNIWAQHSTNIWKPPSTE